MYTTGSNVFGTVHLGDRANIVPDLLAQTRVPAHDSTVLIGEVPHTVNFSQRQGVDLHMPNMGHLHAPLSGASELFSKPLAAELLVQKSLIHQATRGLFSETPVKGPAEYPARGLVRVASAYPSMYSFPLAYRTSRDLAIQVRKQKLERLKLANRLQAKHLRSGLWQSRRVVKTVGMRVSKVPVSRPAVRYNPYSTLQVGKQTASFITSPPHHQTNFPHFSSTDQSHDQLLIPYTNVGQQTTQTVQNVLHGLTSFKSSEPSVFLSGGGNNLRHQQEHDMLNLNQAHGLSSKASSAVLPTPIPIAKPIATYPPLSSGALAVQQFLVQKRKAIETTIKQLNNIQRTFLHLQSHHVSPKLGGDLDFIAPVVPIEKFAANPTIIFAHLSITSRNVAVRAYSQTLSALMEQLDAVGDHGVETLRRRRDGLVSAIEKAVDELERDVAEVWKAMSLKN